MEDIAEQLAIRDRFLKRRQMQMTPQQRMAKMQELQQQAIAILKQSPEGYARFMARNFKKRAIEMDHSDAT